VQITRATYVNTSSKDRGLLSPPGSGYHSGPGALHQWNNLRGS
jgi:hypothetical protein